jgi:hypothetical protein
MKYTLALGCCVVMAAVGHGQALVNIQPSLNCQLVAMGPPPTFKLNPAGTATFNANLTGVSVTVEYTEKDGAGNFVWNSGQLSANTNSTGPGALSWSGNIYPFPQGHKMTVKVRLKDNTGTEIATVSLVDAPIPGP